MFFSMFIFFLSLPNLGDVLLQVFFFFFFLSPCFASRFTVLLPFCSLSPVYCSSSI
ncbi:hypothetical protein KFK09_010427 [Dendrobium nobile]|uniref:Uncharacterized protein n=1 Tax=Dendrobium nobile TaxID=94219 RepID=A0A8T3BC26_DENNO|nr:hypothetical protein KFK09_010427 [Dendrobium nobile]